MLASIEQEIPSSTTFSSALCKISDAYFKPKPWERSGKIYEYFGSKFTQRIIGKNRLVRFLSEKAPIVTNYQLGGYTLKRAITFDRYSRISESIHALGLVLNARHMFDVVQGDDSFVWQAAALAFWNINLIMLQRYNRARIYKVIDHVDRQKQESDSIDQI